MARKRQLTYPQQWLAERLKQAMRDANMTAPQLARALESLEGSTIAPQTVYQWRNTGQIAKHHLPHIATATGKSLAWLNDAPQHESIDLSTIKGLDQQSIFFARTFSLLSPQGRKNWMEGLSKPDAYIPGELRPVLDKLREWSPGQLAHLSAMLDLLGRATSAQWKQLEQMAAIVVPERQSRPTAPSKAYEEMSREPAEAAG